MIKRNNNKIYNIFSGLNHTLTLDSSGISFYRIGHCLLCYRDFDLNLKNNKRFFHTENRNDFSQLPFHDDTQDNVDGFSLLPYSGVHDEDTSSSQTEVDNNISENNVEGNINLRDDQSEYTQAISSNDRSSNNDPFYYDRPRNNYPSYDDRLSNNDHFLQYHHDYMSIPSYHTNPSYAPPSYKSHQTPLLYQSELGVGENYIGGLEAIKDNDSSDNDSVSTCDLNKHHMIRIRGGSATRPTEELYNSYVGNIDSEGFSSEIAKNIKDINTDSNRVTQILKKDLFKGDIS